MLKTRGGGREAIFQRRKLDGVRWPLRGQAYDFSHGPSSRRTRYLHGIANGQPTNSWSFRHRCNLIVI